MTTVKLTARLIRKIAVDSVQLAKALAALPDPGNAVVQNLDDNTFSALLPLSYAGLSAQAQAECTADQETGQARLVLPGMWQVFFEPAAPQGSYQAGDVVLLDGKSATVLREARILVVRQVDGDEHLLELPGGKKRLTFVDRPGA